MMNSSSREKWSQLGGLPRNHCIRLGMIMLFFVSLSMNIITHKYVERFHTNNELRDGFGALPPQQAIVKVSNKVGEFFVPGSLNMTRLEANQKCHIDPDLYKHHFLIDNRFVSKKQKLVYVMVRKSGSTNVRKQMSTYFNDTTLTECRRGKPQQNAKFYRQYQERNAKFYGQYRDYFVFSMSRDPLSRYISGFQEMLSRWDWDYSPPKNLKSFADKYVSANMNHSSVLEALKVFVTHHENGGILANEHLSLQSTSLHPPDCPLKLDAIYEISDMHKVFDRFRTERKIKKVEKDSKRYANAIKVSNDDVDSRVLRKICQLTALDYCCLNYQLPPECEGAVKCQWVSPASLGKSDNGSDSELQIEAVTPYYQKV